MRSPAATVYGLATTATRNPALVLASLFMGMLFGLQRRASGGIQAPMLTHLTWSALMLRFLLRGPDRPGPLARPPAVKVVAAIDLLQCGDRFIGRVKGQQALPTRKMR